MDRLRRTEWGTENLPQPCTLQMGRSEEVMCDLRETEVRGLNKGTMKKRGQLNYCRTPFTFAKPVDPQGTGRPVPFGGGPSVNSYYE